MEHFEKSIEDLIEENAKLKEECEKLKIAYRDEIKINNIKDNELRRSNILISQFIKYSPIYAFIKDVSPDISRTIMASDNYKDMIGISGSEMAGKSMHEVFPKELADKFTKDDWDVILSNKVQEFEEELNGKIFFTIKFPIIIGNDKLLAGYSMDITNQRRAENEIKDSQAKYKAIVDTAKIGIGIAKENFAVSANYHFQEMLGYSEEELLSYPFINFFHPEDRSIVIERMLKRSKGEVIDNFLQTRIVKKDGEIRNVDLTTSEFFVNDVKYIQSIFIDTTEKVQIEKTLKESEERFRLMIKNSNDIIVLINDKGEQFFISDIVSKITGYKPEELTGSIADVLHPEDVPLVLKAWEEVIINKESIIKVQYRHIHKTKGYIWFEAAVQNYLDHPSINAIIGNVRDISLIKENEIKLQELNNTKDKFFSLIAHDLINPFSSILSTTELLIDYSDKFEKNEMLEAVKRISNSAENAYNLLENLLTWAKSQTGKLSFNPEIIVLDKIILDVIRIATPFALEKNIDLNYKKMGIKQIFADRNLLLSTIRNILFNAIKFTKSGGLVEISVEEDDNTEGQSVIIVVTDNGIGMDEGTIKNLFQLDTNSASLGTNNEKGTGLGLILCKEFIEKHNGKIWVESKLGHGSKFIFSLPVF
jgi:PAS domain S-box-containing protein